MDIAGIWQSLWSMPAGTGHEFSALEPAIVDRPSPSGSLPTRSQEALRDILSRYDVTAISPRGYSQLLQELHEAGALSDADHEVLALVRLELDQQGIGAEDQVDLVDLLRQKLRSQERELKRQADKGNPLDPSKSLEATQRQIDWIQKFALIHRSSDYHGLDTAA
jgi:hypothetical protein